jgi:predicted nuclease of restriction endonuclease-like (RecB) superfamily
MKCVSGISRTHNSSVETRDIRAQRLRRVGAGAVVTARSRRPERAADVLDHLGLTTDANTQPAVHSNWLTAIKTRVVGARQRAILAANVELIRLCWQIGRDILERQAQQGRGANVIDKLAQDLHAAFPGTRGFSRANLKYMCAFAEAWGAEIDRLPVGQLPWGHNVLLLTRLQDPAERLRYAEQAIANGWARSTLEANIRDKL